MHQRSAARLASSALAATLFLLTLALPSQGRAFFQKTDLEGSIDGDVSGVYLAVHNMMPAFRVRVGDVTRSEGPEGKEIVKAPFSVGPITAESEALMGKNPKGVVITEIANKGWSSANGIFEGDIIAKLNAVWVDDVAAYEENLAGVQTDWFYVLIRRPGLAQSKARIVKINQEVTSAEVDGVSTIGSQTLGVWHIDADLPFASEITDKQRNREVFIPSEEQVEALKESWHQLPAPQKPLFVGGEHRVVAAAAYDASLRKDDNLKGTQFAMITSLQGNPLTGSAGRVIGVYGVQSIDDTGLRGTYVESTMASAPFPISIEFAGRFTMHRLDDFSNKDLDYRLAQGRGDAADAEESDEDVELAPDIPENPTGE